MALNSLARLTSINAVTSILGVAYSILQVEYFGASREIEIYFIAQNLLYVTVSLSQTGHLAEIFLPEFLRLEKLRKNQGFKALSVIFNRFLLFASLGLIFFFISAPYLTELMAPGYSSQDKALITSIFRLLVPLLLCQIVVSFFRVVLNAKSKYGTPEFIVATTVVINIISLILFYETLGLWALVYAMIVGRLFEFVFYIFQMHKLGYRHHFLWSIEDFDHQNFFQALKSTIVYVSSTALFNFTLTASASFLPEGIYAIFKYVQSLASKVFSLAILPFITIFFTEYSKNIANSRLVNDYVRALISVNVCMVMGAVVFGHALLDLLWSGQKFDDLSVELAYAFLLTNILALVIASLGNIYRKMSVALGYGRMLYNVWTISQIVSACLAIIVISTFKVYGLMSIIAINFAVLAFASAFVFYQSGKKWTLFISRGDAFILGISLSTALYLRWFLGIDAAFVFNSDNWLFLVSFVVFLGAYPIMTIFRVMKRL